MTGEVTINDASAVAGDEVGAFIDGDLRENKPVIINAGKSYTALAVSGSSNGEIITFKLWDQSECTEVPVAYTLTSEPGSRFNDLFIAAVTLSSGNENLKLAEISISPNPTTDILNISVKEKMDYRLLNIRGQTLKIGTLSSGDSKIDISPFAKGVYLLNLKTGSGSFTMKVIRN